MWPGGLQCALLAFLSVDRSRSLAAFYCLDIVLGESHGSVFYNPELSCVIDSKESLSLQCDTFNKHW